MSTKIYTAFRFTTEHLKEGLDYFHNTLLEQSCEMYHDLVNNLNENEIKEKWHNPERMVTIKHRMAFLSNKLYFGDKQTKAVFDLVSCGLNVWVHQDGFVYVIPWGSFNPKFAAEECPCYVEDYCYWDNVDEPENIPWEDWEARGKKWVEVGPGNDTLGFYKHRLIQDVVTSDYVGGLEALEAHYLQKHHVKEKTK